LSYFYTHNNSPIEIVFIKEDFIFYCYPMKFKVTAYISIDNSVCQYEILKF
jgi:hypothetical protein